MYIHGLGIGYFAYLTKINSIVEARPGRGVILLEFYHTNMIPSDTILECDQTLKAIDAIFIRHNLEKVSLVGHSYGTIIASWIIRQRTHHLAKVALVDPICFMMWDSTLCHTFFYAPPFSMMHEVIRHFMATDPLINLTLSRKMYWYESILLPQEITIPTTVVLGQEDFLIKSKVVQEYLEKRLPSHSNLILLDTFHGGSLVHHEYHSQIIQSM